MPELRLPASIDHVHTAVAFLSREVADLDALRSRVELVSEELFVNIASYAYDGTEPGELQVGYRWVNMDGTRLYCIWFRDRGRPFDPFSEAEEPDLDADLEHRRTGGLGLHLIRQIVLHFCYSDSDGSNTVEIYFPAYAQ